MDLGGGGGMGIGKFEKSRVWDSQWVWAKKLTEETQMMEETHVHEGPG